MSRTIRKTDSIIYGGKCHCDMCGINNADTKNRKVYLSNGIVPCEKRPHSSNKRLTRKLLRARLKKELRNGEME